MWKNKPIIPMLFLSLTLLLMPSCMSKQPVPLEQTQAKPIEENRPLSNQFTQTESIETILNRAYSEWQGVPHVDGGSSKNGIDCSGFVQLIFKNKLQLNVPRTTGKLASTGSKIPQRQLQPGDIILFKIRRGVNHVGIYMGDSTFIHASKSKGVYRSQLSLAYWQNHYWQSRRILP